MIESSWESFWAQAGINHQSPREAESWYDRSIYARIYEGFKNVKHYLGLKAVGEDIRKVLQLNSTLTLCIKESNRGQDTWTFI